MLIESFTARQTANVCPAGASVVRGQPVIGPPVFDDCCNIAMLFMFSISIFTGGGPLLINKKVSEDQNGIRRF